jgi:hypothetical protein
MLIRITKYGTFSDFLSVQGNETVVHSMASSSVYHRARVLNLKESLGICCQMSVSIVFLCVLYFS